jgi:hypothetical protein
VQDDSNTRALPAFVPELLAPELPRLLPVVEPVAPALLRLVDPVAPALLVEEPLPDSDDVLPAPVEDRLPLEAAGAVDEVDVEPVVELELPSVELVELGVKLIEPRASSTASGGAGTVGSALLSPVVVVVVVLPVDVAPALELAVGDRLLVDVPPAEDVAPLLPPVAVDVVPPVVEDVLPPALAVQLALPPLAPLVVPCAATGSAPARTSEAAARVGMKGFNLMNSSACLGQPGVVGWLFGLRSRPQKGGQ